MNNQQHFLNIHCHDLISEMQIKLKKISVCIQQDYKKNTTNSIVCYQNYRTTILSHFAYEYKDKYKVYHLSKSRLVS
jgi:hypothetical protein